MSARSASGPGPGFDGGLFAKSQLPGRHGQRLSGPDTGSISGSTGVRRAPGRPASRRLPRRAVLLYQMPCDSECDQGFPLCRTSRPIPNAVEPVEFERDIQTAPCVDGNEAIRHARLVEVIEKDRLLMSVRKPRQHGGPVAGIFVEAYRFGERMSPLRPRRSPRCRSRWAPLVGEVFSRILMRSDP